MSEFLYMNNLSRKDRSGKLEDNMSKPINNILWIFGAFAFLGVMVYALNHPPGKSNETPTPSYRENNLEVLKTARHDDLVICVVEKSGSIQPETVFAFLVDQNDGTNMTGETAMYRSLSRHDGGWNIRLMSPWKCEMRVLQGNVARDRLSSILFDSRNPAPAK